MTNIIDTHRTTHDELAQLNFTDRESYLEWVRQWKDCYKELSQTIRSVVAYIKDRQRGKEAADSGSPPGFLEMQLWRAQGLREVLREYATCALIMRAQGKKESWEMKIKAQKVGQVV